VKEAIAPDTHLAGRYVLEDRIGAGGMATVWAARDEVLARRVAVKILRQDLSGDPTFLERFHREAVAAARLSHPNIVSVFDTGVDDDVCYIVMERVLGETLRDVLDREGRLDPAAAVSFVLPVLSALGAAHAAGIVHRDMKPANILVGRATGADRWVKVADFGLAKAAFDGRDVTQTGSMLGTVRYLSPEQVHGGEVTPATDLYAVGVILYEAVAGRPPFQGDGDVATAMMRLTKDPVPPRALVAGVPRGLEAAILRALRRRPEERFASAAEMRGALERFAEPDTAPGLYPVTATVSFEPARGRGERARAAFRSWMLVPSIVVVLAAGLIAAGLAMGKLQLGGPLGIRAAPQSSSPPVPSSGPLRVASVRDFDPQGDGLEHPELVRFVSDGDPATAWTTSGYTTAEFGGLKTGVGLWLDLGRPSRVVRVTVSSQLPGWTFALRSGSSPETAVRNVSATDGSTSFMMGASGRVTVTLRPVTGRGILIWITRLAPSPDRFRASVSGVAVDGVAG